MKSVTNSKRLPFQVKRYGHDEGFRSSSVMVRLDVVRCGALTISACRMPEGQSTRTTSAPGREPRPNTASAGDTAGEDEDISRTWRRLPALSSTFAAAAERLLTRGTRRTRNDALRLPPSFLKRRRAPVFVRIA